MSFSYENPDNHYDDIILDDSRENNIIILKRVKSLRQLKNSDKEWVKLCYKEAILKGFSLMNHIQCYIASKTKIWIERSGIEYLKKSEEIEDKKWFYHMAKDHHVYIGVYRKCVDELELAKKELWNMIMNRDADNSVKVQCLREIHSITKTMALLLRDLPFVTNLSKYYDQETINSMFNQSGDITSDTEKKLNYGEENSKQNNSTKGLNVSIEKSGLENLIRNSRNKILNNNETNQKSITNVDDSIMEEMSRQLRYSGDENSKIYTASIKKLKEIIEE